MIGIALAIILIVSGGTSILAESSLPGDTLYPIKVGVNEEVRSFIAISSESQARWDARRAERRMEEKEELSAEGRLDAEIEAELSAEVESYASTEVETESEVDGELEIEIGL